MKKIWFLSILSLISISVFAQTQAFDELLHKHVNQQGWVDYEGFKKDEVKLDQYLDFLNRQNINVLGVKAQKAMWINAYNAYTIKLILNHYPLKSILDIKEKEKKAWDISLAKVGGKIYTLNHIEHQILRKKFKDPRIHVGVNCASISCPAIPNHAFSVKNIDHLLTLGMKRFVNDVQRNTLQTQKVELSQIFNWFKDDFTAKGSLITFINTYSKVKIEENAVVSFKEYNWNLNKQ